MPFTVGDTTYLSSIEFARSLGLREGGVATMLRRGKLRAVRITGKVAIPLAEVDRYRSESRGRPAGRHRCACGHAVDRHAEGVGCTALVGEALCACMGRAA